jgi:hypothetical protein
MSKQRPVAAEHIPHSWGAAMRLLPKGVIQVDLGNPLTVSVRCQGRPVSDSRNSERETGATTERRFSITTAFVC